MAATSSEERIKEESELVGLRRILATVAEEERRRREVGASSCE